MLIDDQAVALVHMSLIDAFRPHQLGKPIGHHVGQLDTTTAVLKTVAQLEQVGLLGLAAGPLADVGEGADRPMQNPVPVQRGDPVFHRQAGTVRAIEQLVLDVCRLAGCGGAQNRAFLERIG